MALPTASDNVFPKVILSEGAAPATPASGQVKLYAKTDGLLYSKDDLGAETLVSGGAGGGGGGSLSRLGTTTTGANSEAVTANRVYLKKVTAASAGVLESVAILMNGNGANVTTPRAGIYADNAGVPAEFMGPGSFGTNGTGSIHLNTTARWFFMPCGVYVPSAGDYWIAVGIATAIVTIKYATGGTADRYYGSGGDWHSDPSLVTITTTSPARDYSMYAVFRS